MKNSMKFVKGIGLFFVYPAILLGLGFYAGVESAHFFYPGDQARQNLQEMERTEKPSAEEDGGARSPSLEQELYELEDDRMDFDYGLAAQEAAASAETLCVETEYVLEETDVTNHTVVETTWRLPDKYIGMNREQFLEAMENYEAFPPLSEQERGFIGLEVLSFSRERVVVQMNYRYVQPSVSFYLGVYDNEVIVYLEDLETVYIETDIRLDSLPEALQSEIIQMMWLEDEEALYNFLESYSS